MKPQIQRCKDVKKFYVSIVQNLKFRFLPPSFGTVKYLAVHLRARTFPIYYKIDRGLWLCILHCHFLQLHQMVEYRYSSNYHQSFNSSSKLWWSWKKWLTSHPQSYDYDTTPMVAWLQFGCLATQLAFTMVAASDNHMTMICSLSNQLPISQVNGRNRSPLMTAIKWHWNRICVMTNVTTVSNLWLKLQSQLWP